MTSYGKLNLLAMISMPALATLAAAITPALAEPYAATFVTIFVINLVVMLVGGLGTALLLRGARRRGASPSPVTLLPSLVPAVVGSAWYLFRGVMPEAEAPGREILAGPQYLLMAAIGLWIVAWIVSRVMPGPRAA